MHVLTLPEAITLGDLDVVMPGSYVVGDTFGAHLLVLVGAGRMEPWAPAWQKFDHAGDYAGKRILFMRCGGFGDLLLLSPVIREVKRLFPTARLAVSTMKHYAQVLQGAPFVDELLPYPLPADTAQAFDAALYLDATVEKDPRATQLHMTDYFAELVGVATPADRLPFYQVTDDEATWARVAYPRKPGLRRVGIQVGTSAICRTYPRRIVEGKDKDAKLVNGLEKLVQQLLYQGWEVYLFGAKGEISLPTSIPPTLKNLADADLTFRQSCAVMAQCDGFIGSDSSMLHVCGAIGRPGLGLYGPFPWKIRTAYSPSLHALQGQAPCAPCFHHVNGPRRNHFPPQCPSARKGYCDALADIKFDRIIKKLEDIVANFAAP